MSVFVRTFSHEKVVGRVGVRTKLRKLAFSFVLLAVKRSPGGPEYERNSGNGRFRSYSQPRKGRRAGRRTNETPEVSVFVRTFSREKAAGRAGVRTKLRKRAFSFVLLATKRSPDGLEYERNSGNGRFRSYFSTITRISTYVYSYFLYSLPSFTLGLMVVRELPYVNNTVDIAISSLIVFS